MLYADAALWTRTGELITKALGEDGHLSVEEMRELRMNSHKVSLNCSNGIEDLTSEESEY